MKRISRIAVLALICMAVPAAALCADAGMKQVTVTPDQLKWVPNKDVPEVKTVALWGDPDKGPHGAFHKFQAGFTVPLHTHPANHKIVVISGTMSVAGEDGKETMLPPGSYYTQPAGWKHVTKCQPGSDCVLLLVADGKFGMTPVAGKK